ncbi:unnamed protein product [Hymenolepis diminuta]|uniref:Protein quiver n=1 Tax=Hymenolepis diminuta TaxID=6216 RepID=A0A564YI64_HYMDI|nr:unnamed protein product [Hymenolepis diminuta]
MPSNERFGHSMAIAVSGLACYVCVSVNGSNPECEDPMRGSVPIESPCRQGKSGYEGLAYANYCAKIKGQRVSDGVQIYIRRCSTQKLGGISTHCGQFRLSNELYHGCIATCTQNWCNSFLNISYSFPIISFLTVLTNIF